jgi:hypothetical protein
MLEPFTLADMPNFLSTTVKVAMTANFAHAIRSCKSSDFHSCTVFSIRLSRHCMFRGQSEYMHFSSLSRGESALSSYSRELDL